MDSHLFYTDASYAVLQSSIVANFCYKRVEDTMAVQSAPTQTITFHSGYSRAKRLLDIAFTLLISPLILFVGAIVAILIRLESKGPILYRQKRIGQNGVEFE